MRRPGLLSLLACAAPACGLGLSDDESGGGANLPTLAAGPYGKIELDFDTPADEPYVLEDAAASLSDPAALPRAGGGFRLWFTRTPDAAQDTSEIWYAELSDLRELPDRAPALAIAADADWEAGRVAAPAVLAPSAFPDLLFMVYEAGPPEAPVLGRADSSDGGRTWRKIIPNPIYEGARPSLVETGGYFYLYFTEPGSSSILRAESQNGIGFSQGEPVLSPRGGEAFDQVAVGDPDVIVSVSEAGQLHYGMFYSGRDRDDDVAIGYAGSFDGIAWQRFGGLDPVLEDGPPSELGPAAVLGSISGVLFFHELRSGHQRVAAAVHP